MNEQTAQLLKQLADKLGTTGEFLWAVLVSGQRTEGIMDAVAAGVFFLLLVGGIAFLIYSLNEYEEGAIFFSCLSIVIGAVFSVMFMHSAVIELWAPQYAALKYLMGIVGK